VLWQARYSCFGAVGFIDWLDGLLESVSGQRTDEECDAANNRSEDAEPPAFYSD
jgi:hypothetical protein